MELRQTYYSFTLQPGIAGLVVEVTDGDPVEYGGLDTPFTADGHLVAGQQQEFDSSFVLHVPGKTTVETTYPPPPPIDAERVPPEPPPEAEREST